MEHKYFLVRKFLFLEPPFSRRLQKIVQLGMVIFGFMALVTEWDSFMNDRWHDKDDDLFFLAGSLEEKGI